MFTEAISNIRDFINSNLKGRFSVPNIAIWLFVTRIAKNTLGENLLLQYQKACEDNDDAQQTFLIMLQQIQPLLEMAEACAKGHYDLELSSSDLSFRELVDQQISVTKPLGAAAEPILRYIFAARNMYVHNGRVLKDGYGVSLSAICPNTDLSYKDLCSIVMVALLAAFYARDPGMSKWAWIKYPKCVLSMANWKIGWWIQKLNDFLVMVFHMLAVGVVLILVIAGFVIGIICVSLFNNCVRSHEETYNFTKVDPDSLKAWVEEITPYEQMVYLDKRRKALEALGDSHMLGDSIVTAADRKSEELYAWAVENNMPNIHAWYNLILPNTNALSRLPVYRLLLNAPDEPQGILSEKSEKNFSIAYMPVYADGYYPVAHLYVNSTYGGDIDAFVKNIGKSLAARPALKVMISVGTDFKWESRKHEEKVKTNRAFGKRVHENLRKAGVRTKRITMIEDDKSNTVDILIKK